MMTQPYVTWRSTGMTPTVKFVPGSNTPVEGHDVHFTTSTNLSGSVFVPTGRQGDIEFVRTEIANRVQELAAIHELNG